MGFKIIGKTTASYQISEQIIESIRKGEFKAGERLPSERELSEKMGVSRGPVREALSALQIAGIVVTKNGSGTYVNDVPLSKKLEIKALASSLSDESPIDILEVRESLETKSAYLAAENRTDEDVKKIESALLLQKKLLKEGADPRPADITFHLAIAEASKNPVLLKLMNGINHLMGQTLWESVMNNLANVISVDDGLMENYIQEHEQIFTAIKERDPDRARECMSIHLKSVIENIYKF